VAEAEDEGRVVEARHEPEEQQRRKERELDVGRDLDPAKERARDGSPQRLGSGVRFAVAGHDARLAAA
jgi:hypothetical protein